ncbi:MAG: four helix bundle protein [Nitrospirota bacterium]
MRNTKEKTGEIIDIDVYRFVFETAIEIFDEIFEVSKDFPEEKVFLTEQLRKHAKQVCENLAEAWHVKNDKSALICRLSDAAQAASKAQTWLEYASKCQFLDQRTFQRLDTKYEDIFEVLCQGMKD